MKAVRTSSTLMLFVVLDCGGRVSLGGRVLDETGPDALGTATSSSSVGGVGGSGPATGAGTGGSGVTPPPGSSDPCDAAMPILLKDCASCHGGRTLAESEGVPPFDFLLDVQKLTTTYTNNTTPPMLFVKPGDPEHSRVYQRVSRGEMPPVDPPGGMYPRPTTSDLSVLHYWITSCLSAYAGNSVADGGGDI